MDQTLCCNVTMTTNIVIYRVALLFKLCFVIFQYHLDFTVQMRIKSEGKSANRETGKWGRGHCAVKYTSLQSFLIRWLNNFGDFNLILISWLVFQLIVDTFQPLLVIYIRGNFVYHHWKCTPIYRSLSYPFRFLRNNHLFKRFFIVIFILEK